MPKDKRLTSWVQRSPSPIVKGAMARAAQHPNAGPMNLKKRNTMVNWLMELYGQGKLVEVKREGN